MSYVWCICYLLCIADGSIFANPMRNWYTLSCMCIWSSLWCDAKKERKLNLNFSFGTWRWQKNDNNNKIYWNWLKVLEQKWQLGHISSEIIIRIYAASDTYNNNNNNYNHLVWHQPTYKVRVLKSLMLDIMVHEKPFEYLINLKIC